VQTGANNKMMKAKCENCERTIYLSQADSTQNPTGICECGQGYYAIWSSNKGIEIRKIDAEILLRAPRAIGWK